MKSLIVMASLFTTLLGSIFGCQKPSEKVVLMLMEPQGEELKSALAGISYKMDGNRIHVGHHRLEVLPYVEECVVNDSNHACGVRFEISEDGKNNSNLMYAVLGNGKSKDAALRHAVQGWWGEFAVPLLGSLGGPKPDFGEWPFLFYPGVMAIRGTPPGDWLDGTVEMQKRITPTLRPFVHKKPGTKIISLRLLIKREGLQDMGGRLNGDMSAELVEAVSRIPWPRTSEGYIVYQTYVVRYQNERD